MQKILPMLIVFFCGLQLAAQKLKVEVTGNGDTSFSTKEQRLYVRPGSKDAKAETLKSTAYRVGSGYMLCLQVETGRSSGFTVNKGDMVRLNLADGTLVELYTVSGGDAKPTRSAYGSYLFVFYQVDSQSLGRLLQSEIEKVTVFTSLGEMRYELKEKFRNTIREQLQQVVNSR